MTKKALLLPSLLLVGAIGLSGCATPATRTAESSPTATESAAEAKAREAAEAEEKASSQNAATIEAFAVATHAEKYDEALTYTSPGSLAEQYVKHQQAYDTALKANGDYYSYDQPSVSVTDGVVSITFPDRSYEWTDFEFDKDGLVTTFANPGGSLDEVLWDGQAWSGYGGGATIERISAYRSSAGQLVVILKATANDNPVSVYSFNATYAASDGIQYTSSMDGSEPSADIQPGSAGYIAVVFPNAPFGGNLRFEVTNPITYDRAVVEVPIT